MDRQEYLVPHVYGENNCDQRLPQFHGGMWLIKRATLDEDGFNVHIAPRSVLVREP